MCHCNKNNTNGRTQADASAFASVLKCGCGGNNIGFIDLLENLMFAVVFGVVSGYVCSQLKLSE